MFLVDGEWLDHDDPRVDALWTNRLTGVPAPRDMRGERAEDLSSLSMCRAILGEDEFYIEAAADYDETAYGCLAARMAYGTPITRRNLTHLNDSEA